MYGKTLTANLDIWADKTKAKSGVLRAGVLVKGDAPEGVWTHLRYPQDCWTKTSLLGSGYKEMTSTPPPPPPDPDPVVTLKYVIEVFDDGSIKINGKPYA